MTASYEPSHEGHVAATPPKETGSMPYLTLNDGNKVPMLAYGTGTARGRWDKKPGDNDVDKELVKTILMAINAGYRHIDCAQVYGNETEVGYAIKESKIPREEFYIVTKILGTVKTDTEQAFAESLEKLQVDYVDQYLIHAPFFADSEEELQQKWADFEKIKESGRARSIGVSNMLQKDLEAILKTAKIVPAINQIEYHPYLQHKGLIEFHESKGIATSAYAPLTAAVFSKPGPLDTYYMNLAKKYGVSEADVALRWTIDQAIVCITTSSNEQRLKSYLANIGKWKLTPREVDNIKEIGGEKHVRRFWADKFAADDRS